MTGLVRWQPQRSTAFRVPRKRACVRHRHVRQPAPGRKDGCNALLLQIQFPNLLQRQSLAVRALVRDPDSPRALQLAAQGVKLIKGDLDHPLTLPAALDGAAGVFSVQNYWEPTVGYAGEIRQARTLAEAAQRAGVQLFVQSTMVTADEDAAAMPEHFLSKRRIEGIVDDLGLPRMFLGTVFFMDNIRSKAMGGPLLLPMLAGTLGQSTPLQMLAVDDIGRAAAAAFAAPTRHIATRLDLIGDVLTVPQVREVYRRVTGRRTAGWALPTVLARGLSHEFTAQLE